RPSSTSRSRRLRRSRLYLVPGTWYSDEWPRAGRISPPRNGSGVGESRRRRGGGASEASWRIARGKGRLTRRRRQVAIQIPGTRYSERQLADGAGGGHVELDETVHLDRVFHRELLDDGLDEPRHHHRRRLVLGEAAGHQIEELVLAHLRHGRLMTHLGVVLLHLHVRVGVGAAVLVEDQGVAAHHAPGVLGAGLDPDQTAVAGAATTLGDRLGDDRRGGVRGDVDHLGPGVLVLALAREGDGEDLTVGARLHEPDRRVLHGEAAAEVAVDPLHAGVAVGDGTLAHQVEDVVRPVLDGRVPAAAVLLDDDLDHRGVEGVRGVHRSGTALDVVHVGALVHDDQRPLELAHVLGVDPEVGLQRLVDVDARRDVDEGAT